jgi:hypothetical protein
MPVAVLALLSTPLLALLGGLFRAVILFWPTMLLLGAVHSHLSWVPPLSAVATFLVVALISVLLPGSGSSSD